MDYVDKANRYIKNVLSEKIPTCNFTKLACQRQLDDLNKQNTRKFPYHFDRKLRRLAMFHCDNDLRVETERRKPKIQ